MTGGVPNQAPGVGSARGDTGARDGTRLMQEARDRLTRGGRQRGRVGVLAALLPVLVVVVPTAVLVLAGRLSWETVLAEATAEVARTAEAAAETAEHALNAYAVAAARANDGLALLATERSANFEREAHMLLASVVEDFEPAVVATAIDAQASLVAMSHVFPLPARANLSDRDFYQALRRDDAPAVHVSRMFVGRLDGRLLVAVSRARRAAGRFDGLVTISIDPNATIGAALRRLLPVAGDHIVLRRDDGAVAGSSIRHDAPVPDEPRDVAFDAIAAREAATGQYRAISPAGDEVLVAVRRLQGLDLYAVASRPLATVEARWRSVFAPYLAMGIPAIAALLALSLRVRRDQARLVAANAGLLRDVERTEDRLERARRFALLGTFEVDLGTGSSLRSPEYMAMHGLAPRTARETHQDWLRRLHPDDRAAAEARLLAAIADGGPDEYAQTYRTVTPAGEVRWIAARGTVERDATGRALVLRGIHVDVTSLRSAEVQLAEADARLVLAQDALGIGTWEWSPAQGALFLAPRALQLFRFDPAQAAPPWRKVVRRILPQDRPALWRALRAAAAGATALAELRLRGSDDSAQRWIIIRAGGVDLEDGRGRRVLGVAYDITERKQAEARATMLAREVEHRARNAMTLVAGLVRMTAAPTHEDFVEALEGRIGSLAKTITLLGRLRWSGAAVGDLVREELAAYLDGSEAPHDVRIDGPEVTLDVDSAQQLSMALHELATNSAKYGALSVPYGALTVSWQVDGSALAIQWKERGGPPVAAAPVREGFGSYLIRTTVEQQLGGTVEMAWEPDGLRCRLAFPLGRS